MPAQFKITEAGKYLTRDGRTVEVARNRVGEFTESHPWRYTLGAYSPSIADTGRWRLDDEGTDDRDIVAKAPAPPASKPRPAKGKKAKRRYRVEPSNDRTQYIVRRLKDRWIMAVCDNRRVARILAHALNGAAMKEAQRGGA